MTQSADLLIAVFLDAITRRLKARPPRQAETDGTAPRIEELLQSGTNVFRLSTTRCTCRLRELCRERSVTVNNVADHGMEPYAFREIRAGRMTPMPREKEQILAAFNDSSCLATKPPVTMADVFEAPPKNCTCELRRKLDATGLSTMAIARLLGVRTHVVNQWRAGVTRPSVDDLRLIDAIDPKLLPFTPHRAEASAR